MQTVRLLAEFIGIKPDDKAARLALVDMLVEHESHTYPEALRAVSALRRAAVRDAEMAMAQALCQTDCQWYLPIREEVRTRLDLPIWRYFALRVEDTQRRYSIEHAAPDHGGHSTFTVAVVKPRFVLDLHRHFLLERQRRLELKEQVLQGLDRMRADQKKRKGN